MIALRPNGPMRLRSRPAFEFEHLALPSEHADEFGNLRAERGARGHNGGAICLAVWNWASFALGEQRIELRLRHFEQLRYVLYGMMSSLDARGIYARNNRGAIIRLALSGKSDARDRYSRQTMRAVTSVTVLPD